MPLTDLQIKNFKPAEKEYQRADGRGLAINVLPTGTKSWRFRYRFAGKLEKMTLGSYPEFSLAEARKWREEMRSVVAHGRNPVEEQRRGEASTFEAFAKRWLSDVCEKAVRDTRNIRRVLSKDVLPEIGSKKLSDVTVDDVLRITDRIQKRGSDQMALQTRGIIKRIFSYAVARQVVQFNPAAAIEAKYIAQPKSRDVALTGGEIGELLRAIYRSNMHRAHKLAFHLLILTMVRKSELIGAKLEEIDFETREWCIPADRMKMDRPHVVYMANQAVEMFEELKKLASGSEYVFPSRGTLKKPISKTTLNAAIRTFDANIRDFVIHDFRRSASTALNEAGFNADWIEKCLSHEQSGVRSVYNRAEYADQRREMLQWWADFVEEQIAGRGKVVTLGMARRAR